MRSSSDSDSLPVTNSRLRSLARIDTENIGTSTDVGFDAASSPATHSSSSSSSLSQLGHVRVAKPKRKQKSSVHKIWLGGLWQGRVVRSGEGSSDKTNVPRNGNGGGTDQGGSIEPWTSATSLASQLSDLLPLHPLSYFLSYFHDAAYSSPADAVRAALAALPTPGASSDTPGHPAQEVDEADALTMILELLHACSVTPTAPIHTNAQSDPLFPVVLLALRATGTPPRPDEAFDLARILIELDTEAVRGTWKRGVPHVIIEPPNSVSSAREAASHLPANPSSPLLLAPSSPASSSEGSLPAWQLSFPEHEVDTSWHTISSKPSPQSSPLAASLPLDDTADPSWIPVSRKKKQRSASTTVTPLTPNTLLQQSPTSPISPISPGAWGNSALPGETSKLEQRERTRRASEILPDRCASPTDKRTIDLHGKGVTEAVKIVRDTLASTGCSASDPLRIITGRGMHSENGVCVLKPAVKSALISSGWNVSIWHGGLVVRGRACS